MWENAEREMKKRRRRRVLVVTGEDFFFILQWEEGNEEERRRGEGREGEERFYSECNHQIAETVDHFLATDQPPTHPPPEGRGALPPLLMFSFLGGAHDSPLLPPPILPPPRAPLKIGAAQSSRWLSVSTISCHIYSRWLRNK